MPDAPAIRVAVGFPLGVHVEKSEMIGFGDEEFFTCGIGFFLAFFGAVKDAWNREHGDNGKHFFAAAIVFRGYDQFSQGRVHRESGHLLAHWGEVADVV